MRLVIIHGLPGVGKLTVGAALSEVTGYPVFHNHLVVDPLAAIFGFGTPPFRELRERLWLGVMLGAARANIAGLIFTFSPDCTVSPGFLDRLQLGIKRLRGQVFFVKLVCDPKEQERRMVDASRTRYGKLVNPALFRRLGREGAFDYPPIFCDLRLDTTRADPASNARAISTEMGRSSTSSPVRDRKKHSPSPRRAIDAGSKNRR